MVRDLNRYNVVICDIDDTLIYGFWTDLMRVTWDLFHNEILTNVLMYLQATFKLYKVNQKLRYMLNRYHFHLYFVTARKESASTVKTLSQIITRNFNIMELGTDNPEIDKNIITRRLMTIHNTNNILVIDDNEKVRRLSEVNTLDPTPLFEELIGAKN